MNETPRIRPDSPEAAQPVTFNGWLSRTGCFFHGENAERNAKLDGSTVGICVVCGSEARRFHIRCDACSERVQMDMYRAAPAQPWDGKYPVLCGDRAFTEDELMEWVKDNNLDLESLRLYLTEPIKPYEIDDMDDYWAEQMPDGEEVPQELIDIIDEANEKIRALDLVLGYEAINVRPEIKDGKLVLPASLDGEVR